MAKIKGWHTEHVEVELSEGSVIEKAIEILRKNHNLTNVHGVDDQGQMYENVEYATSHSWISKEPRGIPSNIQREALNVISFLKKSMRGEYNE